MVILTTQLSRLKLLRNLEKQLILLFNLVIAEYGLI